MTNISEKGKFDYNLLDSATSDFLKQKENNMREIVSDAYYQIGKELKEAQDKLAGNNQYNGYFQKWYESLGFKKRTVYKLINRYDLVVHNVHNQKLIQDLPLSLSYEIAKPSADQELKQKVLNGDITTHKQYKELKKEKEQAEKELQNTRSEINKLKSKINEAKKEVPPDLKDKLENLENRVSNLNDYKGEIDDYKKEIKELSSEIIDLKHYKNELQEENNQIAKQAKIVEGVCGPIRKLGKSKTDIEQLLKLDVELDEWGIRDLRINAELLIEIAELIFSRTDKNNNQEVEVYDI